MSKTPHPFMRVDDQIDLLKNRGLLFRSEENAFKTLSTYGYYNIINGYKDNYVVASDNDEQYRDGVSFEQIYSLFSVDHAIRNTVMLLMLDIEETLKAAAAYVISDQIGYMEQDYFNITKYRNRSTKNAKFSLSGIISKLRETSFSDKDPIKYYREEYGNVPPWVLFRGLLFGTLVNYIACFKGREKTALISRLYGIDPSIVDPEIKQLFMDSLFMFLDYRNLCAHGGRIYNYSPSSTIRVSSSSFSDHTFSKALSEMVSANNIGKLILALDLFSNQNYGVTLRQHITNYLVPHIRSYPDDTDYLLSSMGIQNMLTIQSSV